MYLDGYWNFNLYSLIWIIIYKIMFEWSILLDYFNFILIINFWLNYNIISNYFVLTFEENIIKIIMEMYERKFNNIFI